MSNKLVKLLVTVAIVAGGTGFLIHSSRGHAQYYKMVDELMVEPDEWLDKTLRVHGYVEAGSIDKRIVDQKTVYKFMLENKSKRIRVRFEGPTPDTFKDLAEVVAKGTLEREGEYYVLHATELMAKCPSKYEGGPRGGGGGAQDVF